MASKEVPGGALPERLHVIPVEWRDDKPLPVQVTQFDFDSLDTLEDTLREALARRAPIAPILQHYLRAQEMDQLLEGLRTALAEILSARRPELRAWQLAFVGGLDLTMGLSGPDIAVQKLGISKQAFFQGIEELRARLHGRLRVINMRDAQARSNMRARGYRKPKAKPGEP